MELVKVIHVTPELSLDDPAAEVLHCRYVKVTKRQEMSTIPNRLIYRGHPQPVDPEEHLERFRDCLDYADNPLPAESTEKMLPW
jgi:hypothetical protein